MYTALVSAGASAQSGFPVTNLLVSAGASAQSGFPVTNLLVIIGLLVVGWPLFRKVRKSASENRKRRWVQEGLMKPPNTDVESEDRSAEPGAG